MCLSRLKEFRTIGDEGYKVFRIRGGKLTTLCAGKRDKPFLRGRWLKAKDWHEESRSVMFAAQVFQPRLFALEGPWLMDEITADVFAHLFEA